MRETRIISELVDDKFSGELINRGKTRSRKEFWISKSLALTSRGNVEHEKNESENKFRVGKTQNTAM